MKFPIITTAIVALCAFTLSAEAQAPAAPAAAAPSSNLKVATVNVKELYTLFYKRFDTESVLQKQLAEIKKDIASREDRLRELQEEAKKISTRTTAAFPIPPARSCRPSSTPSRTSSAPVSRSSRTSCSAATWPSASCATVRCAS